MTVYHLAPGSTAPRPTLPPPTPREAHPVLSLQSTDGSKVVRLNDTEGWILMPGATGLQMAQVTQFYRRIPGMHGSLPAGFRVPSRPVFLPLYVRGDSQLQYFERRQKLIDLIDPHTRSFKIVATTAYSSRELICRYDGGLEGNDAPDVKGLNWEKLGLRLTAASPFARSRAERRLIFQAANSSDEPFMGVVGGTDAPWPGALTNSAVIGTGMEVFIGSEVPVHPRLDLIGPMDSFESTMAPKQDVNGTQEWLVDIPLGVPAGSTFSLVTDGQSKSIRLDGQFAAGRVSLGSTLRPFQPGTNILDVTAPGGTPDTRIVISWYDLYWSLW